MNLTPFLAIFILLLPGLAWYAWFPAPDQTWMERFSDAVGISLAVPPLVGLGAFLWGVHFGAGGLITGYALMAGIALSLVVVRSLRKVPSRALRFSFDPVAALPVALFLFILFWRFLQARDLVLPAWVDSLHHTLIVRLFLETGGVPASFAPYMPVPFYYHFGFHLNTALFAFFGRLSPERAVLVFGQIINAVVALAAWRMAIAVWDDWRRAGVTMFLVGLVLQMPAYYLTWGRYTLLAGLVLLALGMATALEIVRKGWNVARLARMTLYTGGILLTHYYAAALLALFILILLLERTLFGEPALTRVLSPRRKRALLGSSFLGLMLAFPWVWRVFSFSQGYIRVSSVAPGDALDQVYFSNYLSYLWYLLGPWRSHVLLGVALVALLLLGWRSRTRPFGLWAAALGVVSLPWGVRVAPFRPDHGVIVSFLPVALLVSDLFITTLDEAPPGWFRKTTKTALAAAIVGLAVWGLKETRDILNPVTVFASEADLTAIRWIEKNTPPGARFLLNVTRWQGSTYRGVDGGWWISVLTDRETVLPPALYSVGGADYVQQVNALAQRTSQVKGCTPEFGELMTDSGAGYVYLGNKPGSLTSQDLAGCPGLEIIYSFQGISIYERTAPSG